MPSQRQEYEDAMLTADVSIRVLQGRLDKLRGVLVNLAETLEKENLRSAKEACAAALLRVKDLDGAFHSPDLAQWRGERGAAQNRARAQQEVLARKLAAAKQLLLDLGWERDVLEAHLKAAAPVGRQLAKAAHRERRGGYGDSQERADRVAAERDRHRAARCALFRPDSLPEGVLVLGEGIDEREVAHLRDTWLEEYRGVEGGDIEPLDYIYPDIRETTGDGE